MKHSRIEETSWLRRRPVAHRGLHDSDSPENSLSAYQKAMDGNYPIEIDVHLTKDGRIAVFHDDNLERMCGVDRKISDCTAAELKALRLDGTGETIPMLDEVLSLVGGRVPLLIEIKSHRDIGELEEKLVESLRRYEGEFALQSFNPFILKRIKKLAPEFLRGQLATWDYGEEFSRLEGFVLRTLKSRIFSHPDFVSYNIDSLPNKYVTARKYTLLVWTVRDEYAEEKAGNLKANIIFEHIIPKKR